MSGYNSVDNLPDNDGELECPIKSPEHNRVWETEKALNRKQTIMRTSSVRCHMHHLAILQDLKS